MNISQGEDRRYRPDLFNLLKRYPESQFNETFPFKKLMWNRDTEWLINLLTEYSQFSNWTIEEILTYPAIVETICNSHLQLLGEQAAEHIEFEDDDYIITIENILGWYQS